MVQLSYDNEPIYGASERVSAPKPWNSRLSMTMDRPNVLRIGSRKPLPGCG